MIFLSCFVTWFVGSNIYNFFYKAEIAQKVEALEQELNRIAPIKEYKIVDKGLVPTRALINRVVYIEFINEDKSPDEVLVQFYSYFKENGWVIDEYRTSKERHILAHNEKFIIHFDELADGYNRWGIMIRSNDFFSKYHL